MLGFDFHNKNSIPAWHITGYEIESSLKTDLRFAALKFAGGIERRNVGLTKMLSKVHSAHFASCNN